MFSEIFTSSNAFIDQLKQQLVIFEIAIREEMLSESNIGRNLKQVLDQGELIGPILMNDLVTKHLKKTHSDVIICDYPRTREQQHHLSSTLNEMNYNIDVIWCLELVNVDYVLKVQLEKMNPVAAEKYDITQAEIIKRITLAKESVHEVLAFWSPNYQVATVKVNQEQGRNSLENHFQQEIRKYLNL